MRERASSNHRLARLISVLILVLSQAVAGIAISAEDAETGYLQICLGTAADDSPVYATDVVPDKDVILACFRIHRDARFKKLTGTLIAVDVGSVAPPNYHVASTDFQPQTMDTASGDFKFSLPRPFPLGKYRVDVTCDGNPWKSIAFTVVAPPASSGTAADLIPLNKRQVWNYTFVQQLGPDAKISIPPSGTKRGPDGKIHSIVQIAMTDTDNGASHVVLTRAGQPFSEEWWQKTAEGVAVIRRKTADTTVTLGPPELIVRQPPLPSETWEYTSKDGSVHHTTHEWGPVPIKYGQTESAGYVVLSELPGSPSSTVERDYVPGVGMVRSVLITGMDGKMVSREEMTLNP